MALTALEIKDKRFYVKFRGYDAKEVEEFKTWSTETMKN